MAVSLTSPPPLRRGQSPTRVLLRMKAAGLRHALKDRTKAGWAWAGAVVGFLLAVATGWAAWVDPDLLAVAFALWMLGWIIGPLFAGSNDELLRPEYFTAIGIGWHRLAPGLLAGALLGFAPMASLLATCSLLIVGLHHGPGATVVSVLAVIAQSLTFLTLSKLAVGLYGLLLRRRIGAVVAGLVSAFIVAFMAQGWALIAAFFSTDVVDVFAAGARILPSGWGLAAVEAAGRGDGVRTVGALVGLLAIAVVAAFGWALLLSRRVTGTRVLPRPRRVLHASSATRAAFGKELRSATRDPQRSRQWAFALGYAVFFTTMPLAIGWAGMLPWTGAVFVVLAATMTANSIGAEGTAFWLLVASPGSAVTVQRARQRVFFLTTVPVALTLTLVLTPIFGAGQWPFVLATLPAVVGAALGATAFLDVFSPIATTDPHKRSSDPLNTGQDDSAAMGTAYLALLLVSVAAAPPVLVAFLAGWWAIPAGILTGILGWRVLGRAAERRIETHDVEILALLRSGRDRTAPAATTTAPRFDTLPRATRTKLTVGIGVGILATFPQGIVPIVLLVAGSRSRVWFLALYLPDTLRWPAAVAILLLGLLSFGYTARRYAVATGTRITDRRSKR